jgi:hypothetical protein
MTSNKSLNTLYMETQENDPKTWQALMNRIHYVWHIGVQVEPQLNPYNIKTPKPAQLSLVTDTSLIKSFS